ncbi:YfdX family protein [Mesobacterium sp. TK19101]|uniref:YfdX family protein n=1 Tax=Mesobacterium hydrothermale TaxID=3111907 RepID=A0ABU6HJL4_9RHOB|nr:YfdX family protein [Mesobacterium sp. TK19101]MEC3862552.1 YfdX family protein [Mesobacterium sp. TK19101]
MKRLIKTLMLTTVLAGAMLPATRSFAATTEPRPMGYAVQDEMLMTAHKVLQALADVESARMSLAIQDHTTAREHVDRAINELAEQDVVIKDTMIPDTTKTDSAPVYAPFTVTLVTTDKEGVTYENELAIQKAYGAPQVAKPGDVLAEPHLEDLKVAISAGLLPVDDSLTFLVEARSFMKQGDYKAADRSLQSLENAVVYRTYMLDAIPRQGNLM